VSHRTMSISIQEPSHGPQMWEIFRSPSTRKQSYRKSLIQSSCLLLRLVSYRAGRETYSFGNVSTMDQRSIVLHLHLKGLWPHVIHDDLVAILDPEAVAFSTVPRYLREAKLGTAEVTLDPDSGSPHLDDSDRPVLAALEEKKSRLRPCENLPEPSISHALWSIEGSSNLMGSCDAFFTGCCTFSQTLRR
jgi:hypothetical protein